MRALTIVMCVAAACGLVACATALDPAAFEDGRPVMRPETFFAGATSSDGVEESRSGAPTRRFHVAGHGATLADGRFRLDQDVTFDGRASEHRTWILTRTDAHHDTASLTDADGPVEAEAYGNLLHLRYAMKAPIGGRMEQWMYLQPDGRTVVNEATVTVFGVVAAHLSERITHDDR